MNLPPEERDLLVKYKEAKDSYKGIYEKAIAEAVAEYREATIKFKSDRAKPLAEYRASKIKAYEEWQTSLAAVRKCHFPQCSGQVMKKLAGVLYCKDHLPTDS